MLPLLLKQGGVMLQKPSQFSHFYKSLSRFGLNPREWQKEDSLLNHKGSVLLKNRRDESFKIRAKLSPHFRGGIQELELVSI
jgi:hypothetical protein